MKIIDRLKCMVGNHDWEALAYTAQRCTYEPVHLSRKGGRKHRKINVNTIKKITFVCSRCRKEMEVW